MQRLRDGALATDVVAGLFSAAPGSKVGDVRQKLRFLASCSCVLHLR